MDGIARIIARFIRAAWRAYGRKWSFLALFLLMLFASGSVLAALDLLPDPPVAGATDTLGVGESVLRTAPPVSVILPEEPMKIEIPELELEATIANPTTTDVGLLDTWLLKGAVRYPTSAKLGEEGNVVLFGHSSYLPVVHNPAYKTFNDIQKLKEGDTITISSSGRAYTYQVRGVAKQSTNDAVIPLAVSGRVLTLSTCDSFGAKTDRFVLTADFVESHPLGV